MDKDIKEFCRSCLHCHVNDQRAILCPLGEAVHGKEKNEALHFDFISMHQLTPKSKQVYKYVLILKDVFSGFVELILTTSPAPFTIAESLMDRYKLKLLRPLSVITAHISWTTPSKS